jgi:hypothetical protein
MVWRVVLAVSLAAALARGEDPDVKKVVGTGHAQSSIPRVTDEPEEGFADPKKKHDMDKGGVTLSDYELMHGILPDDKHLWAKTDRIDWSVLGATLEAEGSLHDRDPTDAASASSEAWGHAVFVAQAKKQYGDYAQIRCVNTVAFSYAYTVSGTHIGEASVQLQGNAFDIEGKRHSFNLSDQHTETVTADATKKSGFAQKDYGSIKASYSASRRGPRGSVAAERGGSRGEHSALEAKVTRRFARAGGANDSSPMVEVEDRVSGATPFSKTYKVYSDGRVILRARGGTVPEGEEPEKGAVVVRLDSFHIRNHIKATISYGPEPFDPPPAEKKQRMAPPEPAFSVEAEEVREPRPAEAALEIEPPYGLSGETGSLPGRLTVRLPAPAARVTVFLVASEPSGLLDLAAGDRVTVARGARVASLPFHAATDGGGDVQLVMLDAWGGVAGATPRVPLTTGSTSAIAEARLWVGTPGRTAPTVIRGLAGGVAAELRVGRLGFAGMETLPTTVTLAVSDPDGVLAGLPEQIVIPRGRTEGALSLALLRPGRATLVLTSGAARREVEVVGRTQSWSSVPTVTVPLGAVAPLRVSLAWRERAVREVNATLADPAVAELVESDGRLALWPGETAWYYRVRGHRLGTTQVALASPGLSPLTVTVRTVPRRVFVEGGMLRLRALPAAAEGTIDVWVPEPLVVSVLDLPQGVADHLAVEGIGSGSVRLVFTPSPDMPENLDLPIVFAGEAPPDFEVGVFDLVSEPDAEIRNGYHVGVR